MSKALSDLREALAEAEEALDRLEMEVPDDDGDLRYEKMVTKYREAARQAIDAGERLRAKAEQLWQQDCSLPYTAANILKMNETMDAMSDWRMAVAMLKDAEHE